MGNQLADVEVVCLLVISEYLDGFARNSQGDWLVETVEIEEESNTSAIGWPHSCWKLS